MEVKKIIWMSLLSLVACTNSQDVNDKNVAVVKQMFDHFNKHQWKEMAAMYSDVAMFKDPSLGNNEVRQSRAEIASKYEALGSAIVDVHDSIVNIYSTTDHKVVVEFVSTGTDPGGQKFALPICTILTIDNGQITHDFTYYDNMEEPVSNTTDSINVGSK